MHDALVTTALKMSRYASKTIQVIQSNRVFITPVVLIAVSLFPLLSHDCSVSEISLMVDYVSFTVILDLIQNCSLMETMPPI